MNICIVNIRKQANLSVCIYLDKSANWNVAGKWSPLYYISVYIADESHHQKSATIISGGLESGLTRSRMLNEPYAQRMFYSLKVAEDPGTSC